MLKKLFLIFIICSITVFGFAQKSKHKSKAKAPKNTYFEILVNGEINTPPRIFCPYDTILFTFEKIDSTITDYSFEWYSSFSQYSYFTDSIQLAFPITALYPDTSKYNVEFRFEFQRDIDTVAIRDTLKTTIYVDYFRTSLDTNVCQGRDITVSTHYGDVTFNDVQRDESTTWDTLPSHSGCDSLVRWYITMDPYITEEYKISSCDSVIWGDIIAKRPPDRDGDYTDTLRRVFRAIDPDISCDTLKILTFTIIDTAYIKILEFNHDAFCSGDDPNGTIELETNFTAFNWIINWTNKPDVWNSDKDSIFTKYEKDINGGDLDGKNIDITYSGWYYVMGYMDTTLYETLTDLRIVNDCSILMADTIVEDCTLIIPNVITPNGDKINDVLGIKKLNPHRENDLTIYDRWGKNVFHQKNYKCVYRGGQYENDAEAFDGKSRGGGDLPEGTYYYAFKYDAISKAKTYTGTILILR